MLGGSLKGKIAALFIYSDLKKFKSRLSYERYGGAPLLGTRYPIIKAHGSSKASAIRSAVLQAKKCYESKVCEMIASDMERKESGEV